MTLQEIIASEEDFLDMKDIAPLMKTNAQRLRDRAHENPAALGFNVSCPTDSKVLVPRLAFLKWMGVDTC